MISEMFGQSRKLFISCQGGLHRCCTQPKTPIDCDEQMRHTKREVRSFCSGCLYQYTYLDINYNYNLLACPRFSLAARAVPSAMTEEVRAWALTSLLSSQEAAAPIQEIQRLIAANPAVVTDISGSGRTALIEAAVRETGPVRLQ